MKSGFLNFEPPNQFRPATGLPGRESPGRNVEIRQAGPLNHNNCGHAANDIQIPGRTQAVVGWENPEGLNWNVSALAHTDQAGLPDKLRK
jgi:hypothetical protein